MSTILGPDGKPASDRVGFGVTCLISDKRRQVELVKANRKTVLVRVPRSGLRPATIIKRHLVKHGVGV